MTVVKEPVATGIGTFVDSPGHNSVASSSAMRFWARSIGERDPRYVDDSAAGAGDRFEAHPCWLYSVHDTIAPVGHRGLVPVVAGTAWTFGRPVVVGDRVRTSVRLAEERRTVGRLAGPTVVQEIEVVYESAADEHLATARTTLFRISPEQARGRGKHADWARTRYVEDQLVTIETACDAEDARSRPVRVWDDVTVGQDLDSIVRGPVTSEETTLFTGATRPVASAEVFTAARLRGEVEAFVHPRTGTYESYSAACVDDTTAQQLGFPAALGPGIDRIGYTASVVTSWMGPRGRLRAYDLRLVTPALLGDTTWCFGRVSGKPDHDRADGRGVVELELWTRNQHGVLTARGSATVELDRAPRRGGAR